MRQEKFLGTLEIKKENRKEHHWVPQTYLKSWTFTGSTIYEFNKKGKKKSTEKNINNILKTKHLYSKKVADIYVINDDNEEVKLKEVLEKLEVICEGVQLSNWKEYCEHFLSFDTWEIKDKGREIGKNFRNAIRQQIAYWFDAEIEVLLDKEVDSTWEMLKNYLVEDIEKSKTITKKEIYKEELLKFVVIQYFRTPWPKEIIKSAAAVFDTYKRLLQQTALSEHLPIMERCYWLKNIEVYLEEKIECEQYNYIQQVYDLLIKGKFNFFVNKEGHFITSDNPVVPIFDDSLVNGLYIPLTPRVLLFIANNSAEIDKGHYNIVDLDKKHVACLNKLILRGSQEHIYHRSKNIKGIMGSTISEKQWKEYLNNKLKRRNIMI